MKIQYDFIFLYFLERLGRHMHENKTFYFILFNFYFILIKTRYLIPDLYLYSIKIQTDIDKNAVTKLRKITDISNNF